MLIDCVGTDLKIHPFEGEMKNCNRITALAGAGLSMDSSVYSAAKWYSEHIAHIE